MAEPTVEVKYLGTLFDEPVYRAATYSMDRDEWYDVPLSEALRLRSNFVRHFEFGTFPGEEKATPPKTVPEPEVEMVKFKPAAKQPKDKPPAKGKASKGKKSGK